MPSLKARVSVDFVAAAIALSFLYQEKLNQGSNGTEAEALISLEDLAATLKTHLKGQLPASATEKMTLLAELKRHRLLRYRPIGSVHELVSDEILDFDEKQLQQDIERMQATIWTCRRG